MKNDILKDGGEEMISSLEKIINQVDKQRKIPEEWKKMAIKSIHKKGERTHMGNKRGLFLTNNISKVYERIIKERNDCDFRSGLTEWQTGGIKNRSPIDNVLTTLAVIEQNKYYKKNTYLTVTDAEKCFDKLWLQDGVSELWRCGTDIRDCTMIKKLNEEEEIIVKTPVGDTQPIKLYDIVRQGSVYGPQICNATMDKINLVGKDIVTMYGPDLTIRAVVFVDDVSGMGGIEVADNLLYNCKIMEERKKMCFNNKNGKTEYLIVGKNKSEMKTVTEKVKKGRVERVGEHKMLGTWVDETGNYMINIKKKQEKLPST